MTLNCLLAVCVLSLLHSHDSSGNEKQTKELRVNKKNITLYRSLYCTVGLDIVRREIKRHSVHAVWVRLRTRCIWEIEAYMHHRKESVIGVYLEFMGFFPHRIVHLANGWRPGGWIFTWAKIPCLSWRTIKEGKKGWCFLMQGRKFMYIVRGYIPEASLEFLMLSC